MNKFTKEFRLRAIELKKQGVNPDKIFIAEGVDTEGKQKDYACKMINKWRSNKQIKRKLNSKESILLKKIKKQESEKKIEYLEAKVAYLEAEKDFLGK